MKKTGIQIFMDNDVLIHEIRTFKKWGEKAMTLIVILEIKQEE